VTPDHGGGLQPQALDPAAALHNAVNVQSPPLVGVPVAYYDAVTVFVDWRKARGEV
jgi:hypothetical protein